MMHRSPQNQRGDSNNNGRPQLVDTTRAKNVFFYKDGDQHFKALRLAIHPKKFRSFDILLKQLTEQMPSLGFGVRSIYTPSGHHHVNDLDDLVDQGKYVCSTHRNKAKGVDVERVSKTTHSWHGGSRPDILSVNTPYFRSESDPRPTRNAKSLPPPHAFSEDEEALTTGHGRYGNPPAKKITVLKNGNSVVQHKFWLNRKNLRSFETLLDDFSDVFKMAVHRVFTTEGRPIRSLSAIFNGSDDVFVAAAKERFKPLTIPPPQAEVKKPFLRKNNFTSKISDVPSDRRDRLSRTRGKWRVWVTTNELPSAGTTANVSITVYGHKGNSGAIPLVANNDGTFSSGEVDEFLINVGTIGEIYKIRLTHDNAGDYPGWYCDQVRMVDEQTEEDLTFVCHRWLSREDDDGEIVREVPVLREGEPVLPVISYEVSIVTGDLWNAGTTANVYMTVYGERGDTGVRHLFQLRKLKMFSKGQTAVISLEAVSLGNLRKILIGHNGAEPGDGWFLEKVVIRNPSDDDQEKFVFWCNRWLDAGEDDGRIVREVKVKDEYDQDQIEREMWEHEKWKFGRDNQVMLLSKATQRGMRIKSDTSVDGNAEVTDETAVFTVMPRTGNVRVFSSVSHPNFHLAVDGGKVLGAVIPISVCYLGRKPISHTHVAGKGGSFCEFLVKVQPDRSIILESVKYALQHVAILQNGKPGDTRGTNLGPSKQFFCYCKGMFRDGGIIIFWTSLSQTLNISHDNSLLATGRKNRLAQFQVHKVADASNVRMFESVVFPGQFIRLKEGQIDISGKGDKYCQFRVVRVKEKGFITLESVRSRGIFIGMTVNGRVRPTVDTGEKNVRLYPEVITFGLPKEKEEGKENQKSPRQAVSKVVVKKDNSKNAEDQSDNESTPLPETSSDDIMDSSARVWTADESAKPKQRRQTTPGVPETPEATFIAVEGEWKVWITSLETIQNGDVAIVVYGDKGNSGLIILGGSKERLFKEGTKDEFKVNLSSVGVIYKVRLELVSTHKKKRPSWKVREVKLQDISTKEVLKFKYNQQFSLTNKDPTLLKELPAIRPGRPILPVVQYIVQVFTGDLPGSDTDANVFLNVFGTRGDTGRRLLFKSENSNKFEEGQVDTFLLEAVSLEALTHCVVSHDGTGPGEGWYCEKIVITGCEDDPELEHVFPCQKWLDSSIADKKLERTLYIGEITENDNQNVPKAHEPPSQKTNSRDIGVNTSPLPPGTPKKDTKTKEKKKADKPQDGDWYVWITTGRKQKMVANQSIFLVVYGKNGSSDPIPLVKQAHHKGELFQQGITDRFDVNVGEKLGDVYKIRIGTDDSEEIVKSFNWYLEKVKMKNVLTSEQLNFPVNQWLSRRHENFDLWKELPVVRPRKKPLPVLKYRIQVYTGSEPGSETDAVVYINIYGARGDTGKRVLYKSDNDNLFELGQLDVFTLEAVDLGDLSKVIVGHNGEGHGAGWLLDKILIDVEKGGEKKQYYFPCNRWFDEGEDDGKIERELTAQELPEIVEELPTPEPEEEEPDGLFIPEGASATTWNVWVTTGKKPKMNVNQGIFLYVYGADGHSEALPLAEQVDQKDELFKTGAVNKFVINTGEGIGEVYKIRVGVSDVEEPSTSFKWFLEKIKMTNVVTLERLTFNASRWLSRSMEDCDLWAELPVIRPRKKPLSVLKYRVMVYTGSEPASDTDAEVYINMYGERGDTGKRLLYQSDNEDVFEFGQLDEFAITAVDLGELSKVVVGHNGHGHGAGWYLDKIIIKVEENNDTKEFYFPCNRWLDEGEDDRKIERELVAQEPPDVTEEAPPPDPEDEKKGSWNVWVTTGKQQDMVVKDTIYIYLYGPNGHSDPLPLVSQGDHKGELFQAGAIDQFLFDVPDDIGEVYKIRVGVDDTEELSSFRWFLEKVKLKNVHSGETLTFSAGWWLSRKDDNLDLWKELPAVRPKIPPRKVLKYRVQVYTGSEPGSETDAVVYINMYGERGDTGKRVLYKSDNKEPFELGQVDVFELEAVDLGEIIKVIVGHNGQGHGAGWYLEKVIVQVKEEESTKEFYFPCKRWFDEGEDDGKIERELMVEEPPAPPPESTGEYHLWIRTADDSLATNGSRVILTVYGADGKTDDIILPEEPPVEEGRKQFEAGNNDEFDVNMKDIGEIYKIRIGREDKDSWDGWHLEEVRVQDKQTEEEYKFTFDRWLSRELDDFDLVREMPVMKEGQPVLPVMKYGVSVYTGNHWASYTDSNVYVTLHGSKGDSGRRCLYHSVNNDKDKFCKNQMDFFQLEAVFLQDLTKIEISHDGTGLGSGLFIDKLVVKEMPAEEEADLLTYSSKQYVFPCGRWLDDHVDDGKTCRELRLLDVIAADAQVPAKVTDVKTQGVWKVTVFTSDVHNAGTHAQVYLTVYGDKGVSDKLPLGSDSLNTDDFAKGKESSFVVKVGDIGAMYKIRLEHDNQNSFPDWHVDKLVMTDEDTGEEVKVYIDRWFAMEEDDGLISREFPVNLADSATLPVFDYSVAIYTKHTENQPALPSQLSVKLTGDHGDTGKHAVNSKSMDYEEYQVDVFTMKAVSIGQIQELALCNESEVEGGIWYLEKIVVKEAYYALRETVFTYGEWIKPSASKTLTLSTPVCQLSTVNPEDAMCKKPSGEWSVWVTTGQSGTKSGVSLEAQGTLGSSESIPLVDEDGDSEPFLPGKTSSFDIDVGDIGELMKIRISLDSESANQDQRSDEKEDNASEKTDNNAKKEDGDSDDVQNEDKGWNLVKIRMKHKETGAEFHFVHNDWVDVLPDNPEASVELPAIRPDLAPPESMEYVVTVRTGDAMRSTTQSNIRCNLIGEFGDTGSKLLNKSLLNDEKFGSGQFDSFIVRALDIGFIKQLVIGHSTVGRGLGWYCEDVRVKTSPLADVEHYFPCFRWFDTGCEDRALLRDLVPLTAITTKEHAKVEDLKSRGHFKCFIKISAKAHFDVIQDGDNDELEENEEDEGNICDSVADMRTHSRGVNTLDTNLPGRTVVGKDDDFVPNFNTLPSKCGKKKLLLSVYGATGMYQPPALTNKSEDLFAAGKLEEFELECGDIGDIYKIRVCQFGRWRTSEWVVQEAVLEDVDTAEVMTFDFSHWLGTPEDDPEEDAASSQAEDDGEQNETKGSKETEIGATKDDYNASVDQKKEIDGCNMSREMPFIQVNKPALPILTYQISVHYRTDPSAMKDESGSEKDGEESSQKSAGGSKQTEKDESDKNLLDVSSAKNSAVSKKELLDDDAGEAPLSLILFGERGDSGWRLLIEKEHVGDEAEENGEDKEQTDEESNSQKSGENEEAGKKGENNKKTKDTNKHLVKGNEDVSTDGKNSADEVGSEGNESSDTDSAENLKIFLLEAVSLGNLRKLALNKSSAELQNVSKIVVTEGEYGNKSFVFDLDKALKVNGTQCAIPLSKTMRSEVAKPLDQCPDVAKSDGVWSIEVVLSEEQEVPVSVPLTVTLCGVNSESEPLPLRADEASDSSVFADKRECRYNVKVDPEIGDVFKVRLSVEKTEKDSEPVVVKFDKLVFRDETTHDEFVHDDDFEVSLSADSDGIFEFPAIWPAVEVLPVVDYQVSVFTGKGDRANTDRDVFITVNGSMGSTGKRMLTKSQNATKFSAGQMDVFKLRSVYVEDVESVTVGIEGTAEDCDEWLLDKVLINDSMEDSVERIFICKNWFGLKPEDNVDEDVILERELLRAQEGEWLVTVVTSSDVENGGTDAQVSLTVFGEYGDSGAIPLGSPSSGEFESGSVDEFCIKIDPGAVGKIRKIRLEHDNNGEGAGWHVDHLKLTDLSSGAELMFPVSLWLDATVDDGSTVRELPAVWPDSEASPVTKYLVEIHSGANPGDSSATSIYAVLHGDKGDSGRRGLLKSQEGNKFESGKVDTFTVEAVDLGALMKVAIGHAESGPGSDWFPEKVIVKEITDNSQSNTNGDTEGDDGKSEETKTEYIFNYDLNQNKDEDATSTQREYTLQEDKLDGEGQNQNNSNKNDNEDDDDDDDDDDDE